MPLAKFSIGETELNSPNPIRNLIVEEADYYLFSLARNHAGIQGLIDMIVL